MSDNTEDNTETTAFHIHMHNNNNNIIDRHQKQ